ncbi:MAG: hypothetical protein M1825_000936 [Sarcosagium campestre]|nr:MAG: hypothetical protein M1825_000936 [Sarcosagium campestre]
MQRNLRPRQYSAPPSNQIPLSKQKYVPRTGTYPQGFRASGTHVGVKPGNKSTPDLALIISDVPCSAAAVFTKNKFQAAPVTVSREVLRRRGGSGIKGVVINSGCANAVTGRGGLEDAENMAAEVDRCTRLHESDAVRSRPDDDSTGSSTLVMSTGVIGQRLPISKILTSIPSAYSSLSPTHDSWLSAARAICTTDTFPKLLSRSFTLPSSPSTEYRLCGMTKGAGMIHPNMATLLGVLCTDAPVVPAALAPLLTHAVSRSFNSISVDGDTSTNDTVALLANGAAISKSTPIDISTDAGSDYVALQQTLTDFAVDLAKLVVRDGEGATKFVTVRVTAAPSYAVAHAVAASVARSPLVKTALYGRDANWGRVLCAVGYTAGLPSDAIVPEQTSVSFVPADGTPPLKLLVRGEPEAVDEDRAREILEHEDLEIVVKLRDLDLDPGPDTNGDGEEAVYWTCDFSHEYVTINGDYRT